MGTTFSVEREFIIEAIEHGISKTFLIDPDAVALRKVGRESEQVLCHSWTDDGGCGCPAHIAGLTVRLNGAWTPKSTAVKEFATAFDKYVNEKLGTDASVNIYPFCLKIPKAES